MIFTEFKSLTQFLDHFKDEETCKAYFEQIRFKDGLFCAHCGNKSEKTKTNLDVVCKYLMKNHTKFDPSELQTFSPFQLTQKGTDFIKEIGFDNVFEKNKKDFFSFIDSENPKLKYDVENSAIKAIAALYDESYMDFLKVFFYNNPKRNLENTAPTLGVYIRDKYLEEHPEITQ